MYVVLNKPMILIDLLIGSVNPRQIGGGSREAKQEIGHSYARMGAIKTQAAKKALNFRRVRVQPEASSQDTNLESML